MRVADERIVLLILAIFLNDLILTDAFTALSPCGVGPITSPRSTISTSILHPRHSINSHRYSIPNDEEDSSPSTDDNDENSQLELSKPPQRKRDIFRNTLRRLADLSLKDYEWRSNVFRSNEADRSVEESLARMMGEDPSYVRPMDASDEKRGPLGQVEKEVVTWLGSVIEEEGRRAKQITDSDGELVRPIDVGDGEDAGPLAKLEGAAVTFVESIRDSEIERVNNKISRPKDVEETKRGPLGNLEAKVMETVGEIAESERMRMEKTKAVEGKEVVRPIDVDVPGPMGEAEAKVVEAIKAEKLRSKERVDKNLQRLRPMDASVPGPLGNAERNAMDRLDRIKEEEMDRLENIGRFMNDKRPMEVDRDSPLGTTEAFTVGLVRAPALVGRVLGRVKELVSSKSLQVDEGDKLKLTQAAAEIEDPLDKENDT